MASFLHTARESGSQTEFTDDSTRGSTRIRILCLHGGCHNGTIFRQQLQPCIDFLKKATKKGKVPPIEFMFVDGPLLNDGSLSYADLPDNQSDPDNPSSNLYDPNAPDKRQRMWFHEPSSLKSEKEKEKLEGVDASLLWLSQCWNVSLDSDPYHGILAFSQGAALAAMLPLITARHYVFSKLRFVMLVSGYIPNPPPSAGFGGATLADHFSTEFVDMPSLHIVGQANDIVLPSESNRLVQRFVDPVVYRHDHGHCLPATLECFNVIGEFIRQRGLELMKDYSHDILNMQARLRTLEADSQTIINHESGVNPPRALMAVIDRKEVGGWSGDRRVEPGGGAPCPSDFVLKEKERKVKEKEWGEGGGKADRCKPATAAVNVKPVIESQDATDPQS